MLDARQLLAGFARAADAEQRTNAKLPVVVDDRPIPVAVHALERVVRPPDALEPGESRRRAGERFGIGDAWTEVAMIDCGVAVEIRAKAGARHAAKTLPVFVRCEILREPERVRRGRTPHHELGRADVVGGHLELVQVADVYRAVRAPRGLGNERRERNAGRQDLAPRAMILVPRD